MNASKLGRISEPAEYRGAALFCLSDASSFMTGANVSIIRGATTSVDGSSLTFLYSLLSMVVTRRGDILIIRNDSVPT
jgi:hypothetical protein